MFGHKEKKPIIKPETKEYPKIPDTPVDILAVRKKYLEMYCDWYRDFADRSEHGGSTSQGSIYVLWRVEGFLNDLGLSEQVGEVQAEVKAKYPGWDGVFHTHHEMSGHVGASI